MNKKTLEIKHFNSGELKSLIRDDDDFQQAIRLFACYKVSTGMNPNEIASFLEISYASICDWVDRLNEGGIEALVDKGNPGANNLYKENGPRSIRDLIIHRQPYEYGFDEAKWNLRILSKVTMHQFQISYKKLQIYNKIKKKMLTFTASAGYTRFFKNP